MKSFKQFLIEGYTQAQWDKLDSRTKQQYIKDHPNSKYAQKEVASKSNVSLSSNKTSNVNISNKSKYNLDKMSTEDKLNLVYKRSAKPEILTKLANDKDPEVRDNVAYHINTPSEVLAKLANDKDPNVRATVANNLNTTSDVLTKLANDKNSETRENVAEHKNTKPEVLAKLANDKDPSVRSYVARNPNTPQEILYKLATGGYGGSKDFYFMDEVYGNKGLSKETRKAIDNYWKKQYERI